MKLYVKKKIAFLKHFPVSELGVVPISSYNQGSTVACK